jgi:hypothetical protein
MSETLVIGCALIAVGLGFFAFLILGAFAFTSAFIQKLPGGRLSFCGATIALVMFIYTQFLTSGVGLQLQLGYVGSVVEGTAYALAGFLCALGYARLCWFVWRRDRSSSTNGVPGA